MNIREFLGLFYLSHDRFERHYLTVRYLFKNRVKSVLDVGGRGGILKRFVKNMEVTTINVDGSGDIEYGGGRMPVDDNSFDCVVSLDTLEHIQKENRMAFISECLRVASNHLLISVPYASLGHMAAEKELATMFYQIKGHQHLYLREHVENGLPDTGEITQYISRPGWRAIVMYAGDYRINVKRMRRSLLCESRFPIFTVLVKLWLKITSLALFHPVSWGDTDPGFSNRAYLIFQKEKP